MNVTFLSGKLNFCFFQRLFLICTFSFAILMLSPKANAYHLFLGFGQNYSDVGHVRFGLTDWEFGMYTRGAYGATKMFRSGDTYYTSLGIGLVPGGLGFLFNGGFEYELFWIMHIRGELLAGTNVVDSFFGIATLGISFKF